MKPTATELKIIIAREGGKEAARAALKTSWNESACLVIGGYCGGLCCKYHCYFAQYNVLN